MSEQLPDPAAAEQQQRPTLLPLREILHRQHGYAHVQRGGRLPWPLMDFGNSLSDSATTVREMTTEQAREHFADHPDLLAELDRTLSWSKRPYPNVTHPTEPFQWAVPYWEFGPYQCSIAGRFLSSARLFNLGQQGRTLFLDDHLDLLLDLSQFPSPTEQDIRRAWERYEKQRFTTFDHHWEPQQPSAPRAEDLLLEMFSRLAAYLPQP